MGLKIERGRRQTPARVVLYGTEGIGKSTLAAEFPAPLVLDTEEGTHHLDVARVSVGTWEALRQAVAVSPDNIPLLLLVLAVLSFLIWSAESLFEYLYALLWRNLAQTVQHELRLEARAVLLGATEKARKGALGFILTHAMKIEPDVDFESATPDFRSCAMVNVGDRGGGCADHRLWRGAGHGACHGRGSGDRASGACRHRAAVQCDGGEARGASGV